jgi:hypothetical protein
MCLHTNPQVAQMSQWQTLTLTLIQRFKMVCQILASLDIMICNELVGVAVDLNFNPLERENRRYEDPQQDIGSVSEQEDLQNNTDSHQDKRSDSDSDSEYWPIQSQLPDGDPRG